MVKKSIKRHLSFWPKKLSYTFLNDEHGLLCIKCNSLFIRFNTPKKKPMQKTNTGTMWKWKVTL